MSRNTSISLRVTKQERTHLTQQARDQGKSLSDLIREAIGLDIGQKPIRHVSGSPGKSKQQVADWCVPLLSPIRRRKGKRVLRPFKTPFLRPPHAEGFEIVVRGVARAIGTDQSTVAYILAHLGEAIGNVVASGRMFRFPGMFVVGPYLVTTELGGTRCLPRFQASPVLEGHVQWTCSEGAARNTELDAHRRRRRPRKPYSTFADFMDAFRRNIVNQEKHNLDTIENWRMLEPLLLDL